MSHEIYEGDSAKAVGIHHVPRLEKCFVDILSQRPRLCTYLLNAGPTLRFVVKLFDPSGTEEIRREEAFARDLESLEIKTTETLAIRLEPEVGSLPYRISRYIEGYDLDEGLLTGRIDEEVVPDMMRQFGASVARVHASGNGTSGNGGRFGVWPDGTDADWVGALKRRVQQAVQSFPTSDLPGVDRAAVDHMSGELTSSIDPSALELEAPCLVMGDLSPKHIIVEESEYEYHLNGVLGLRHAFLGDPAWDLARLERALFADEPDLRAPFQEGYAKERALPENWEMRMPLYQKLDDFLVASDGFMGVNERTEAWKRLA